MAIIGGFSALVLVIVMDARQAVPDEPASLRWLRSCAEHPLRFALGVTLVASAWRVRRGARITSDAQDPGRSGTRKEADSQVS